jgi:signal transduction histidine kinase
VLWYRLEDCQYLVDTDPSAARELLGELRDQLDQVREQDVRELSHRLHPSIIRAGLLPALDSLAEEMRGLNIEVVADSEVLTLDQSSAASIAEPVRLTAYRVVEEALGNVLKHAHASRVAVDLHLLDGQLAIEVTDDGRGFDQHAAKAGLGLASIATRVDRVGGRWTIGSRAERGTRLSVRLPLAVDQSHDSFGAQTTLRQEGSTEAPGHHTVSLAV